MKSHRYNEADHSCDQVEDFWEAISTMLDRSGEVSKRVAPVCELFIHVAEAKVFRDALVASVKVHDVMELGQGQFARAIEQRLMKLSTGKGTSPWAVRGRIACTRRRFVFFPWLVD
jgi:hypothetical protein